MFESMGFLIYSRGQRVKRACLPAHLATAAEYLTLKTIFPWKRITAIHALSGCNLIGM